MKYLTLIRHAKSSWEFPGLTDKERPLAKRGRKGAEKIAAHNSVLLDEVETFYCSTALRATQTIDLLSRFAEIPLSKQEYNDSLYIFDHKVLIQFIKRLADRFQSIAIIGHNPALTELVNSLTEYSLENIPTCGLVRIRIDSESWKDIENSDCKLVYFDCPKNHVKSLK